MRDHRGTVAVGPQLLVEARRTPTGEEYVGPGSETGYGDRVERRRLARRPGGGRMLRAGPDDVEAIIEQPAGVRVDNVGGAFG
ncbi:hypothetical protein [Kribbella swartbergensis]